MSATGQALPSMQGVYCPMEAEHMASVPAGAYLFRDRKSRPYRDDALLANYLTPRLKKLGLKWPGFGWHAFRRLMATWMAGVVAYDVDFNARNVAYFGASWLWVVNHTGHHLRCNDT